MIDIHVHLLPGLDDGAKSLDEALAMASVAAEDGITTIVATPHIDVDFGQRLRDLPERLAELQDAVKRAGIPVEVLAGSEAYTSPDLPERAEAGDVPTLNGGRFILVEWPLQQYPIFTEQVIFGLQLKGFWPVIAHAERYSVVQENVNMLGKLIERGVLVQVSSASLLGGFGARAQQTAEIMLRHNLAHVLASDAHSASHRPPLLGKAVIRAAQIIGGARATAMATTVPAALIEDRTVDVESPLRYKGRPFWAVWR